jgi:hypothetical protein
MKSLRKITKSDTLLNLFDEIGTRIKVEEVCDITGIKNYNSLKAFLCYIRRADHIPEDSRIDVRIQNGYCIRVN